MNRFVRLILIILLAGFAVSATVVVAGNAWSRRQQADRNQRNSELFQVIAEAADDHPRRLDMVVEGQQVDARGKAIQTTVLVRQYASIGYEQSRPLNVMRIVIPQDLLVVEGMLLEFTPEFGSDVWQYSGMRNKKLAYFSMIRGKDEKAPRRPARDERFTFMPRSTVPELTRIRPFDARPASFEVSFWNFIWDLIPEPPPASREISKRGLRVLWISSAPARMQREKTYTAYVGTDGITIQEDAIPTLPGLMEVMLSERKRLDELKKQSQ
jgi:hypothetical protein